MSYKHSQFSYLTFFITIALLTFFIWAQVTASLEPSSPDSGANLAITSMMIFIVAILASFISLQVSIDDSYLRIKFGYGLFRKKFLLSDITDAIPVKNKRYYGRGIRVRFRPKMIVYNVAGLDAVEIHLENGNTYRIGTDEPQQLHQAITNKIAGK